MSLSYSTATIIAVTVLVTTSICVQTSPVPPAPVQNSHSKLQSLEKTGIEKNKEIPFHAKSENKADDIGMFLYAEAVKNNLIQVIQMLNRKSRAYRFSHPLKAHHFQGRQDDDEDEGGFSELGKDIIKIVGSALSGNVSALIDSSSALIPDTVASTVAGALSVLVESINSARPPPTTTTTTEPSTTEDPEETSVRDLSAEVSELPSTTLEATTVEDEEEGELRSNGSTTVTVSSTAASVIDTTSVISPTQLIPLLSNDSAPVQLTPEAATTTRAEVLTLPPVTETTTTAIPTTTYNPTFEGSDVDNKANWQDLVNNQNSPVPAPAGGQNPNSNNHPFDDIDSDNKANWISLLTNQDNAERLKPIQVATPSPAAPIALTMTTTKNLSLSPLKDSNFNIYTTLTPHLLLVTQPELNKATNAPIKIQNSHVPSPIGSGNRGNSKAPGNNILDAFATANRYPMFSSYPINDKNNNNNKNKGSAPSPFTIPTHVQTVPSSANDHVNKDAPIKVVQIEMGGNSNSNSNSNSLSNKLTALLQSTKPKLSNYSSNVINLIKYQEWLASQLTTTQRSGGDRVSDSYGTHTQAETSTVPGSGSGSSNGAGNSGSESVKGVVAGNGSGLGSSSKNNTSSFANYASGFDYSKFTTFSVSTSTSTSTTDSDTDIEESSVSSIVPGSGISSSTANTEDEDEDEDEENEESNSV